MVGEGGEEARLGRATSIHDTQIEVKVKSLSVSFNNTGKDLFK